MSRFPVRAIDVGFGNTKFVVGTSGNEIKCDLFPSLTPIASSKDLSGGMLQKRSTVIININGVNYEVGKDSPIAQGGNATRVLDPTFAESDAYLALVRGALHYMGATKIDWLFVGLPVSTISELGGKLEKRLEGVHHIQVGNQKVSVNIGAVKALAQPLGAFFDYSFRTNTYNDMRLQKNLIIDPGFFTVDWLLCQGVKSIGSRSNAYNGGVSSILRAIADEIGNRIGERITDLTSIDNAVRHGKNPRVHGKEIPLAEFSGLIQAKTEEAASEVAMGVGTSTDIDNIIVAGGGAELYLPALKKKFPHHEIKVARDSVFANVRGFQRAGELKLRNATPASA